MLLDIKSHILKRLNQNPCVYEIPLITTKYPKHEVVKAMLELEQDGYLTKVSPSADYSYCYYDITVKGIYHSEYSRKNILSLLVKSFILPVIVSL